MQEFFSRMTEHLAPLDWAIVGAYLLFAIGLALYHMRRATSGMDNYFASGRKASWWLLGTSMVATTFAADTPLAVSGWVIGTGISMNWYWWAWVMTHMMGVFFFARLWRRSRVLTDTELVEVRYSGASAGFLRFFRSIYFGIVFNCVVIGWVNLAMTKILQHTVGVDKTTALWFCFGFSLLYTMLAGLSGVMATDFIQFIMAMFGSIYLAMAAVRGVGGLDAIIPKLTANYGAARATEITSLIPPMGSELVATVIVFIFLSWWGATNADSGGYLAQRMLAAKNEKHSFLGMLWFNIAFYCLRPWPWIVVGLCASVLVPGMEPAAREAIAADPEVGYIFMMKQFLPVGILGLVIASFFAAYMSTIDTHLNWGASYLVNDVYKRFFVPEGSDRHYVWVSMGATALIAFMGAYVSLHMDSIREAWYVIAKVYSGVAVIYILRWYWWRINAWSEIAAMASSLTCLIMTSLIMPKYMPNVAVPAFPQILLYIVPITVTVALIATFVTQPVDENKLISFYKKVRPGGAGWKKIAARVTDVAPGDNPLEAWPGYVLGVVAVYSALFGVGRLLLGPRWIGVVLLVVSAACGLGIWVYASNLNWQEDEPETESS